MVSSWRYNIYNYVKGLSSEYGWVPEYTQWFPMSETHCETCCIRDMIECSLELADSGYDTWDVANKFVRNHLSEQQIKNGGFISVDNNHETEFDRTYKDIDKRVVGGWSGGGEGRSGRGGGADGGAGGVRSGHELRGHLPSGLRHGALRLPHPRHARPGLRDPGGSPRHSVRHRDADSDPGL